MLKIVKWVAAAVVVVAFLASCAPAAKAADRNPDRLPSLTVLGQFGSVQDRFGDGSLSGFDAQLVYPVARDWSLIAGLSHEFTRWEPTWIPILDRRVNDDRFTVGFRLWLR